MGAYGCFCQRIKRSIRIVREDVRSIGRIYQTGSVLEPADPGSARFLILSYLIANREYILYNEVTEIWRWFYVGEKKGSTRIVRADVGG